MKLKTILFLPLLPLKLLYYWKKADKSTLLGKEFAQYGFTCGRKLFLKGIVSLKLLLNPVSIVRYFEFDYVFSNIHKISNQNILDISSPYLFGFFVCDKFTCNYTYINPDKNDLNNVNFIQKHLKFAGKYSTTSYDARSLPYPDKHFDIVISISVIEHINNNGDSQVVSEMWRVLKENGKLILTFPVKKQYEEEFRDIDIYNLGNEQSKEKYFFQRIYNEEKINERILSELTNFKILDSKIFGENDLDFYTGYKERWIQNGYWETIKDPFYITEHFRHFNELNELKNIGIMGITIEKLK